MFRALYTAASGMQAQQTNLDTIANNLSNSSTAGYASSQVDKRKVGKLALAIQVAFQEMGVFQTSTTQVPIDVAERIPFSTVQAIENTERTASLGRIVFHPEGALGTGVGIENGDLAELQTELETAVASEIKRK